MKDSFDKDRELERKFKPDMKAILGKHFFVEDPIEDRERGRDFIIFTLDSREGRLTIGARLRRYDPRTFWKYSREFTTRLSRPSGAETEIHKIMKGYVDFLIYCFADQPEKEIIQHFIADFEVFRNHPEIRPVEIKENNPPDSKFAVYRIDQFPPNFVVDSNPKDFWKTSETIDIHVKRVIETERKLRVVDFM